MSNRKRKIFLVVFLVTLFPLSSLVSASLLSPAPLAATRSGISRTTTAFTEDFSTTGNEDSAQTTAAGWGTGTVTSPSTAQIKFLDFNSTRFPVRSVSIQGRAVYATSYDAASTNSLQIFDITNPANIISRDTRNVNDYLMAGAVAGDICYVGTFDDTWLAVYNVSNSFNIPSPLDSMTLESDGGITDIEVQGHFLYVFIYQTTGDDITILDVEDPTNIHKVGGHSYSYALGGDVVGDILYFGDGTYGLYLENISNPYVPVLEANIQTPGNSTDVVVDGGFAYVADGWTGVQIVDVSDTTSLSILGSCNTPGNAAKVALHGKTLFVADRTGGVRVIDVSDPTNPTNITSFTGYTAYDVAVSGGVLVVGCDDGIRTYQIGHFTDLSHVGSYSTYDAWDVKVRGDVAYVAAGPDGFMTHNVSNPAAPVLLDRYSSGVLGYYRKVEVYGHLAFASDYAMGTAFNVFDVSDPANIKVIDALSSGNIIDVFAWGECLFYTFDGNGIAGNGGWGWLNISNPYAAGVGIELNGFDNVTACWMQGYHLYLVNNEVASGPGLYVYDMTLLMCPTLISNTTLTSNQYDVFVEGNYGYLASQNNAYVCNLTDPYNPVIADSTTSTNPATGVWGFGPYMVTTRYGEGVQVVDTRNINNVQVLSSYTGATTALQVTVHGDYVYVANRGSLEILRFFESGRTYTTGVFTAQSGTVDTTFDLIVNATLTATALEPAPAGLTFFLSADGGLHWESVTPGVPHVFANPGSDLRFQVNFTTPLCDRSAHLYDISISYIHFPLPAPPVLLFVGIIIVIVVIIVVLLLLYFLWYKKKEK